MRNDLAVLLERREFESAFVDHLGWDRLRGRESIRVVAPGQLTRGWLSVEERERKSRLRQHTYELLPVAQKRGQVAYEVRWLDSDRLPDTIARSVVARQTSKWHYEPLLIFTAKNSTEQVWLWTHSGVEGLEFCEHRFDTDHIELPKRLEVIRFGFEDEDGLTALAVQRRLKEAFHFVRQVKRLERRQLDPEWIGNRWNSLHELANLASEHRGLDKDEERALVAMALDGNTTAKRRLTLAHMYLPIDQTLKMWERSPLDGTEVPDLVQAGMMGLVRAVDLYDFTQSPRLQTFASLWVRRNLDYAWRHQGRLIKVPNHVFERLERTAEAQDILFDCLAQINGRLPTKVELAELAKIDKSDLETLRMMEASFLPFVDGLSPELTDEIDQDRLVAMARMPRPDGVIERLGTASVLGGLGPKQRDVLLLRFGLHPDHGGEEMTLEQTARIVEVSTERARQIQKQAMDQLRAALDESGGKSL